MWTYLFKREEDLMISMAQVYSSKRECNEKEAVYHIMPEILYKIFSSCSLCNKDLPEKHFGSCFNESQIHDLSEDSADIYKKHD